MDIFVDQIARNEVLILKNISKSTKIKAIKCYLELKAGIPFQLQRLQYLDNGDLNDDVDLKECSVVHNGKMKLKIWEFWEDLIESISKQKISRVLNDVAKDKEKFAIALYVSVSWGQNEVVDALLGLKDDINGTTPMKRTPLHAAAVNGDCFMIEKLILRGADINIKDTDGKKPLSIASQFKNKDVERFLFLLHWKERTDKIPPWKDSTPLMMHQRFDSGYPTWKRGEFAQMYMSSTLPPIEMACDVPAELPSAMCDGRGKKVISVATSEANTSQKDKRTVELCSSQGVRSGRGTPKKTNQFKGNTMNVMSSEKKGKHKNQENATTPKMETAIKRESVLTRTEDKNRSHPPSDKRADQGTRDFKFLRSVSGQESGRIPQGDEIKKRPNLYEDWKYVPSLSKLFLDPDALKRLNFKREKQTVLKT